MKKIVMLTVVLAFAFEANAQVATTGGGTVQLQNGGNVMTQGSPVAEAPVKAPAKTKHKKHTAKKAKPAAAPK